MPLIISVTGAHSSCGKTTVCELLFSRLPGKWGAIKYTKTAFYTSVSDDVLRHPQGKDTHRMHSAGAHRVIWVQAPREELKEVLPMSMNMLSECTGIIVEGNSPIEFLSPDIVIFVFGRDINRIKPSAERIIERADFVIFNETGPVNEGSFDKKGFRLEDYKEKEEFLKRVMERVKELSLDKALKELKRISRDNKIACSQARRIAEAYGLPYKTVGEMADREGIKIKNCELGCF